MENYRSSKVFIQSQIRKKFFMMQLQHRFVLLLEVQQSMLRLTDGKAEIEAQTSELLTTLD